MNNTNTPNDPSTAPSDNTSQAPKAPPQRKRKSSSNHPRGKKPRRKLDGWNKFAVTILTLFLVGCVSVFFVLVNIVNDPEGMRFSKDGLSTLSNSRIFDESGNMIYEFGSEIRDDVSYEQIPQNVIDAFLSIEDSRYFTHNGFDLPRFIAAAITNLSSGSFSQGGSTLTMQMIDNAFTKNQESKLISEKGSISKIEQVKLKIQEIYLALIAEQTISKEDIMEYYLNRIWFGSGGNTRGIQKAAKYYFNKDVSALNLGESAFLAGSINAPFTNNPLNNIHGVDEQASSIDHLAAGQERRNQTLELMLKHGYITEEEFNLEANADLAFALDYRETISVDPNQAYIDQTINEVQELTGQDPSIIPMDIYTALNVGAQNELDKIMKGEVVPFPNEMLDVGTAIVNNSTGEIIAVGPGRHYHSDSVKQDNSINTRQPGSAMKPLLSYSSTFDILGWATTHVVDDKAKDYWHAGSDLRNSDGKYDGPMTLSKALGVSKNTTAAQAMIDLVDSTGLDYWINFCKNLGFDTEVAERFVPQYCIGGADMYASPIQMASAYSMFANQGTRINAHRVRRVIRRSDNAEIMGNSTSYELISPAAAFMMSTLLREVVYGGYQNYNEILGSPYYTAYGKSGTSSWEEEAVQYGIPPGVMKDEWSMGYTNTYTISTWSGYLPAYFMQGYYMTWTELQAATAFHINRHMLDFLAEGGNYAPIERPEGVSDYNGGFIKSDFAARGDITSGTLISSEDSDEKKEEENKKACEASGGTFADGTCTCPEGTVLNGNACGPKDSTTENPNDSSTDPNAPSTKPDDPIINPEEPNPPVDPNVPVDPNAPVEPIVPEEPIIPDNVAPESAQVLQDENQEEHAASENLTSLADEYSNSLPTIDVNDLLVLAPSDSRLRALNQMIS